MDTLQQQVERELRDLAPEFGLDPQSLSVVQMENGVVTVRFTEGCYSCPAGLSSIIMGLESELQQRVPEVEIIEAVM